MFAVATFIVGPISTQSKFCQASGYFLQSGIVSCGQCVQILMTPANLHTDAVTVDLAILFMSVHMCLQIFPPSERFGLGHDGLYHVRHWILGVWIIVPNVVASLAFINRSAAYMAQGAFCTLPIRPFWYRLALSWIPRYLIWIYVLYVAIRIYRHVGREFQVFGQEHNHSSSVGMPGESAVNRAVIIDAVRSARRKSLAAPIVEEPVSPDYDETIAPDDVSIKKGRSMSLPALKSSLPNSAAASMTGSTNAATQGLSTPPTWSAAYLFTEAIGSSLHSGRSNPTSRRGSRQIEVGMAAEDFAPQPPTITEHQRESITTIEYFRSQTGPFADGASAPVLPPIREESRAASSALTSGSVHHATARVVKTRRRAIQRQLRLLFIYPVVYMLLWIVPFISHCMQYSNYYAQHPSFYLSALVTFCQCFMGFTDVVVFSWREKPWRHIPGSDKTFLGSFRFWRICWATEWWNMRRESRRESRAVSDGLLRKMVENEKGQSQAGLLASIRRWSISLRTGSRGSSQLSEALAASGVQRRPTVHNRTRSGGSDRTNMEADRAHQRLKLERAEYEKSKQSMDEARRSWGEPVDNSAIGSPRAENKAKDWWDRELDDV